MLGHPDHPPISGQSLRLTVFKYDLNSNLLSITFDVQFLELIIIFPTVRNVHENIKKILKQLQNSDKTVHLIFILTELLHTQSQNYQIPSIKWIDTYTIKITLKLYI